MGLEDKNGTMLNTLEILKNELQKDEMMFYEGAKGSSSKAVANHSSLVASKKRPQTGSLNARAAYSGIVASLQVKPKFEVLG